MEFWIPHTRCDAKATAKLTLKNEGGDEDDHQGEGEGRESSDRLAVVLLRSTGKYDAINCAVQERVASAIEKNTLIN